MSDRALERWKRLRATGVGDGVLEVPSVASPIQTGFGQIRFAVGPEGQPRLLVPVASIHASDRLASTPKLAVTVSRFSLRGKQTQFVDVMSLDRGLDPVFAELAEEILRRVQDGNPPVTSVTGAIDDFRELLRERRQEEIPDSRILGLVGELHVLKILTGFSTDAVEAWTGPYEQRHDFRRHIHALEVKTSGRSDAMKVSINGSEQLAAPSGGSLALVHVRMEMVDDGDMSVGKLVESLLAAGVDRGTLYRGLTALECANPMAAEWNRLSFHAEGLSAYTVREGFPRITNANFPSGHLPAGIASLQYELDLSHAARFELAACDFEIVLNRVAA